MLRSVVGLATRCLVNPIIRPVVSSGPKAIRQFCAVTHPFSASSRQFSALACPKPIQSTPCLSSALPQLLENKSSVMVQQTRSVTKYSMGSCRRKTVKHVIKTFYRLQWGIWIRARAGRNKYHWRKCPSRIRRGKNHVFCTATQSTMLDKMTSVFWRRPKYWVDDPYEPYQMREEYCMTRKKALPAHTPPPEN